MKVKKDKIYFQDGKIKNKGCDKYLKEALDYLEDQRKKGKKGAEIRWGDGTANGTAIANHKPQATRSWHSSRKRKPMLWQWRTMTLRNR